MKEGKEFPIMQDGPEEAPPGTGNPRARLKKAA